ncbi:MAG: hypothetical protein EZS28_023850, partial [Streblomastix strix]
GHIQLTAPTEAPAEVPKRQFEKVVAGFKIFGEKPTFYGVPLIVAGKGSITAAGIPDELCHPPCIRRADLSHPSQLRCPPLRNKRGRRGQRRDGRKMIELKGELDRMRNVSQWDQYEETHQKDQKKQNKEPGNCNVSC